MRDIGRSPGIATRIHEEWLRQFVRDGCADARQLGRYAARRRRTTWSPS